MSQSDYIDGIYNYCDRWCERCPLTARCRVFALEEASDGEPDDVGVDQEEFWSALHETYIENREMLLEAIRIQGIDLGPDEMQAAARDEDVVIDPVRKHPIVGGCRRYADRVSQWFRLRQPNFESMQQRLETMLEIDADDEEPQRLAQLINDATDVIHWYQCQIPSKVIRALLEREACDPADTEDLRIMDADGSAKVALIGIDRSVCAWSVLRDVFEDLSDDILTMLAELGRLRREVEEVFPKARAFQRPGFDASPSMSR